MLVYENSTYQFITSSRVQQFASQLREAYETIDQVEEVMDRGENLEDVPAILAKENRAVQMRTDSLVEILKQLDTFLASAHKTDAGYFVDQTNKLYKGYGASKYVFPEEELARVLDGAAQKRGSAYYSVADGERGTQEGDCHCPDHPREEKSEHALLRHRDLPGGAGGDGGLVPDGA